MKLILNLPFLLDISVPTVLFSRCSQHSNLLNQARLAVLKARDDSVKGLVDEARASLGDITEDSARYKKMLEDLIAQV